MWTMTVLHELGLHNITVNDSIFLVFINPTCIQVCCLMHEHAHILKTLLYNFFVLIIKHFKQRKTKRSATISIFSCIIIIH